MIKKKQSTVKHSFEVYTKFEAFFTGGRVQFMNDGQHILSICQENLKQFDMQNGKTCNAINNLDGENICSFLLAADDETLVTAATNGVMHHWHLPTKRIEKTWKSLHLGPVSCMAFDSTTTLLATGGPDSTVKIWDILRKYYTHNLKGGKGVYSTVSFHKIGDKLHLFGAADDCKIHLWNLHTSEHVAALEGFTSTVICLLFPEKSPDRLLSCSRDQVVLVWDLSTFSILKTIPVFEALEACILVPENISLPKVSMNKNDTHFITAGNKGVLRVWSMASGCCIYEQKNSHIVPTEEGMAIMQAMLVPALEAIGVVTAEHNILLYSLNQFNLEHQYVGYNDDILSIKFVGKNEDHLAVATNSSQIKIFSFPSFNCHLLKGHDNIVLSLDVFPKQKHILVSGSKDKMIKVWTLEDANVTNLFTGVGHTAPVTAVCCCKGKSKFFVSGSEDTTLKLWKLPDMKLDATVKTFMTDLTVKAHEKLINAVDISINDKFVATASQDHTAKLWESSDLSLVGIFRGHKKGVWCVKFSPIDLVLVTSSGDDTIRIWSIADFSCLKVFEGHEASVLHVSFLTDGTQLISSASDGNIKLWDIKNSLCVNTFSEHEARVWTLAPSASEEFVVSGAADSNIVVWKDTTQIEKDKSLAESEEYIVQEQELLNLLQKENWLKALGLAITLDKPHQAHRIIQEILHRKNGEQVFTTVFLAMRQDQKESLLKFSVEWMTNTKTFFPAVLIFNLFYKTFDCDELLKIPDMPSHIRDALPYLDRHFKRLNRRCQDMQILNFLCCQYKIAHL